MNVTPCDAKIGFFEKLLLSCLLKGDFLKTWVMASHGVTKPHFDKF